MKEICQVSTGVLVLGKITRNITFLQRILKKHGIAIENMRKLE